jgi:hypothetical protein
VGVDFIPTKKIFQNPPSLSSFDTVNFESLVFLPPQNRCDTAGFHNARDETHMTGFPPLK